MVVVMMIMIVVMMVMVIDGPAAMRPTMTVMRMVRAAGETRVLFRAHRWMGSVPPVPPTRVFDLQVRETLEEPRLRCAWRHVPVLMTVI
jgi:hypothetical protein